MSKTFAFESPYQVEDGHPAGPHPSESRIRSRTYLNRGVDRNEYKGSNAQFAPIGEPKGSFAPISQ
jgi:hypothetical protein